MLVVVLLFSALGHDPVDKADNLLVYLMGLEDRVDHGLLRNLVGAGFDHDHLFSRGGYGQRQVRNLLLRGSGVNYKLAVN